MRPSRSLAIGFAVWLLVVALGSTLVWVVISRAGDGVVSSQAPAPTAPGTSPAVRSPSPSPSPSTTPPAAEAARRTWQGVGGQVTVECRGSAAGLVSAIPDSGFGLEVDDRGPDRVRVELERAGDGDRSRIEASCVDGIPAFEADVDTD